MFSLQGDADLAEVPSSIVYNESYLSTSDTRPFDFAFIEDRALSSRDRWALESVVVEMPKLQVEAWLLK